MSSTSRIAGAGGSDLFAAGTYKISDGTLNLNGTPKKINAIVMREGGTITSGKYEDNQGEVQDLALNLLTDAMVVGETVTFNHSLHEIIIADASAIFYFD